MSTPFYKINDNEFRVGSAEVGVNTFILIFNEEKTKVSVVGKEYNPILLNFTDITDLVDGDGNNYYSYEDLEDNIGGFLGETVKDYIELECGSGLFDFSYDQDKLIRWEFPDGSTSTEERPTRTLGESGRGVVKLYASDLSGDLNDNLTNDNYLGDIRDLKSLTRTINLYSASNAVGSIDQLTNNLFYLNVGNGNLLSGSLDRFISVTNYLRLSNCSKITGSYIGVEDSIGYLYLQGTGMSSLDTELTLKVMSESFITAKSRTIQLVDNVNQSDPTIQSYLDYLYNIGCSITFV